MISVHDHANVAQQVVTINKPAVVSQICVGVSDIRRMRISKSAALQRQHGTCLPSGLAEIGQSAGTEDRRLHSTRYRSLLSLRRPNASSPGSMVFACPSVFKPDILHKWKVRVYPAASQTACFSTIVKKRGSGKGRP